MFSFLYTSGRVLSYEHNERQRQRHQEHQTGPIGMHLPLLLPLQNWCQIHFGASHTHNALNLTLDA